MTSRKKEGDVTLAALDAFLAGLDADRERAGAEYEMLRRRLMFFFDRSDCPIPDELTDDTINRTARRLAEGEAIQNLQGYCSGVARHVLQEYWKRPPMDELPRPGEHLSTNPEGEAREDDISRQDEQRFACMRQCLHKLPPEVRELVVRHSTVERGKREQLAKELGLTVNVLRLKVFYTRRRLATCRDTCLKKIAAGMK